MRIYELPEVGYVLLANPLRAEEAELIAPILELDWFLSDHAPADRLWWLELTPDLMKAKPLLEIPGENDESPPTDEVPSRGSSNVAGVRSAVMESTDPSRGR